MLVYDQRHNEEVEAETILTPYQVTMIGTLDDVARPDGVSRHWIPSVDQYGEACVEFASRIGRVNVYIDRDSCELMTLVAKEDKVLPSCDFTENVMPETLTRIVETELGRIIP